MDGIGYEAWNDMVREYTDKITALESALQEAREELKELEEARELCPEDETISEAILAMRNAIDDGYGRAGKAEADLQEARALLDKERRTSNTLYVRLVALDSDVDPETGGRIRPLNLPAPGSAGEEDGDA